MIRTPIPKRTALLLAGLSFVALVGGYTYLSHAQHVINPNDKTIPSWSQIAGGIAEITARQPTVKKEIWVVIDTLASLSRLFIGLAWGVGGALALGILMGCFARWEAAFKWLLSSFAKIPPTAMMAVFFALTGTDMQLFSSTIAFGILPTLALTTYLTVKEVPDELVHKAYTLGASPLEVIWDVICKNVFPKLIDAIRLQIGPAMVFLIATEALCSSEGFGYRIRLHSRQLDMHIVYPYLVLLMALGFIMDYGLRTLQRKACPWYAPQEGK